MPEANAGDSLSRPARRELLALALLCAATLAVFSPLLQAGFITWDDPFYVTENKRVLQGLSGQNLQWAFSTLHFGFYYPLTWLSHMADCSVYGGWAGGHHLTSLLIHVGSSLLLFAALRAMTRQPWPALLTAALFALHPLHVESVAWIAERKDVLGALFFMAMLYAYVKYAQRPRLPRYLAVLFCLSAGLMAKPTLVPAPLVLLLLDYWPLRRWGGLATFTGGGDVGPSPVPPAGAKRLVLEKVPLLALSALFSLLTLKGQVALGAVSVAAALPLQMRVQNALVSLGGYLGKTVFPSGLAVYYPYPLAGLPSWKVVGAGALLLLVTAVCVLWVRRRPYGFVGWFWYLAMLAPVLGIVQAGRQASADRYTYLSLVGLFVAAAWGTAEGVSRHPGARRLAAACWLVLLAVFAGLSYRQAGFWKDNLTLFGHALEVTTGNDVAECNYGVGLYLAGDWTGAKAHLKAAISLRPDYTTAWGNLGEILLRERKYREAEACYEMVLKLAPGDSRAHNALGLASEARGRLEEAEAHYERALQLAPDSKPVRLNLARVRGLRGGENTADGGR